MRYRIAVVIAPAGWGKTAAVRAALEGVEHRWVDLAREAAAFDVALLTPKDRIVVLDGIHLLAEAARKALVESTRSHPETRWLLIARRRDDLPIARWIASGDAGAPVLFEDLALGSADIHAAASDADLR
ncbi:MAG TPA: hypothetical protein VK760_16285, partial [Candidatus Acidoferrales bacterium]|nr:hypothetical protein [Candidatus Acidoferrales bacterium]